MSISTDGGSSWTQYTPVSGVGVFAPGLGNLNTTGIYADHGKIYVSTYGGGVSISRDGGSSWITSTSANGLGYEYTQDVHVSGNDVDVATQAGLSISRDDGITWRNINTNPNIFYNTNVWGVCASDSTIYSANVGSLSISRDGGSSWTSFTTAIGVGGAGNPNGLVYGV